MTVKFNDVRLPKWVNVTGISFQTLPELDVMEYEAPRRVGRTDSGVKRGGSTISLTLMLEKDKVKNIHQQKDELKAWAIGDNWKPSKLIFDEQPDKYYMARVSNNMTIDDLFTHGETDVEFYCADPLNYDTSETIVNSVGGVATIDYKGLENVPVKILVQNRYSIHNPRIENLKTNKATRLTGNIPSDSVITIDGNKKKLLLNGEPAMKLLAFESAWLYLEQGIQQIKLTEYKSNLTVDFQVIYRQAD